MKNTSLKDLELKAKEILLTGSLYFQRIIDKKNKSSLAKALRWRNDGDSFDQRIFELISKSQSTPENYLRLLRGFPDYVAMWEEWQNTENEEDFFNKYGA